MGKRKEQKFMEDTKTVIELTELVSPVDPIIRQGFEIKLEDEYEPRLTDPTKPWGIVRDPIENHRTHVGFRDAFYKFFVTILLIHKTQPGEIISVKSIADEIRGLVGEIDLETFANVIKTIYMYLTRQLPLPKR